MINPLCKKPHLAKVIRNTTTVATNVKLLGDIARNVLNSYEDIEEFSPTNDFENIVYDYFHSKLSEKDTQILHKELI